MHEGCILPFLAHGRCPICGESKSLSLPDGVKVRVFKETVEWSNLLDRQKTDRTWRFFVNKTLAKAESSTLLWLPFLNVTISGTGTATVLGEMVDNYMDISSKPHSNQRFYYEYTDPQSLSTVMYAGAVPVSERWLDAIGFVDCALASKELDALDTEPLVDQSVPHFEFPTDPDHIGEIGKRVMVDNAQVSFPDKPDVSYVLTNDVALNEIKIEVWLVPIRVGVRPRQGKEPIRYSFLGVGKGLGQSDLPISPGRLFLFVLLVIFYFILYWVGIVLDVGYYHQGYLMALMLIVGSRYLIKLILFGGRVYDSRIRFVDDDAKTLDLFNRF